MKKTRRDFLKTVGVTTLGVGSVMVGKRPASAQAKTFKWRMATPWPTGIPLFTHRAKVLPDLSHQDLKLFAHRGASPVKAFPFNITPP
ncbi:MAG: twin-arginine translocation signal domain-containing protein [Thermodesulfobacteriota bacterium]